MFRGSVKSTGYPLHSTVSPFTYPPVCHRVPSHFNWSLLIDLFIHFFLIYKSCCYPVKQLNHFPVKYNGHYTCTLSLTLFFYPSALSPDCLCPLSADNVSQLKYPSVHNPYYLSPTVLGHTLTFETCNVRLTLFVPMCSILKQCAERNASWYTGWA